MKSAIPWDIRATTKRNFEKGILSGGETFLVLTEGDLGSPTFCPQTLNRLTKHSLTRL